MTEILNKYIAATGGLEAWRGLQTVDAHGSFNVPPFNSLGDFDFYYKLPASDAFQLFMTSHGQTSVGHNDGTSFFNRDAEAGLAINGVTVDVLEEDWLALTESEPEQYYERIELLGLTTVNGQWAYALLFTPKVGDRQRRYYDCQSFLLIRMDLAQRRRTEKNERRSPYEVDTYYSDYGDFGGIKFPKHIKASSPYGVLALDIHSVHTNRPVTEAVFRKK